MKHRYTYRAVCYVDVIAESEEEAIEKAEELFPYEIDVDKLTIYEISDDGHEWNMADRYNDEKRLGI